MPQSPLQETLREQEAGEIILGRDSSLLLNKLKYLSSVFKYEHL